MWTGPQSWFQDHWCCRVTHNTTNVPIYAWQTVHACKERKQELALCFSDFQIRKSEKQSARYVRSLQACTVFCYADRSERWLYVTVHYMVLEPRLTGPLSLSASARIKTGTGPNFIQLLKPKVLLNNFLLSRNEQDTSHNLYM